MSEEMYKAIKKIHEVTNESVDTIIKEAIKFYFLAREEITTGNNTVSKSKNLKFQNSIKMPLFNNLYCTDNEESDNVVSFCEIKQN